MKALMMSDYGVDIGPAEKMLPEYIVRRARRYGRNYYHGVGFALIPGSGGDIAIVPRESESLLIEDCEPYRRIEWDGVCMAIEIEWDPDVGDGSVTLNVTVRAEEYRGLPDLHICIIILYIRKYV